VAISSQVDTCPVTLLPFKDHPKTQASQTNLRNKPQEKQTSFEPLAWIVVFEPLAWIVSSLV